MGELDRKRRSFGLSTENGLEEKLVLKILPAEDSDCVFQKDKGNEKSEESKHWNKVVFL